MVRHRAPAAFAALIATTLAGGCATPPAYPSLAIRAVEREAMAARPTLAVPYFPPAPDAALAARLADLRGAAAAAHRAFTGAEPKARRLVAAARGSQVATEAWSVATVAVADLEGQRGRAMVALADLDALLAQTATEAGAVDAVADARQGVIDLIAAQDATLTTLYGGLRTP